jgi:type III pantothenate kinase
VTPDVVVDIGNSRMKWAGCGANGFDWFEALPLNLPSVWKHHFQNRDGHAKRWVIAGSNGTRRDEFADWLHQQGAEVVVLDDWRRFGIRVDVTSPERVGHDRLFNAVAAARIAKPVIVVSAGTAVTVDLVDESGVFLGGAIFPGVGLMAKSLHQHTDALPHVSVTTPRPALPAKVTEDAISGGIWWAIVGAINGIISEYQRRAKPPRAILLTGGDAELLHPGMSPTTQIHPTLTLDGIRIAAEALP